MQRNTIEAINKKLKSPHFYIFSDDIVWCQNNFSELKTKIFIGWNKGDKSYIDMFLMSMCKYNIIAASTFLWWSRG